MDKKRWISIVVVIVLLIVYVRTDVLSTTSGELGKSLFSAEEKLHKAIYQEGTGKTIALLNVNGVIQDGGQGLISSPNSYNHQLFLKEIEKAFSDEEIKAVVLAIDSPGGGVYESDEIYQKLKNLKAKYPKPLIVSMGSVAASGGYYIAMAADEIFANRNTLTGSIGVIMATYNYSQLADKLGIEEIVFKSGKNKDIMNPMRDISQEEKEIMQRITDEFYGYFVDVVAQGRKMEHQKVKAAADGRIYTASQAKALGLIDQIGDLEQAIGEAASRIKEENPKVIKYIYKERFNWERLLSMVSPHFDLQGIIHSMENNNVPTAMYLYR